MDYFVNKNSIVRKIWGNSDTILFIFVGSAAEFALNKAVDWLHFTGRLPADPLGRLFSTVTYAHHIFFSDRAGAYKAIDKMAAIHAKVECNRGSVIPDWAYRDVLFMLIDYSIRAFEILERKLTEPEKQELCLIFLQIGYRMGLTGLPGNYREWVLMREQHLQQDLVYSHFTADLYRQYKKHLGTFRYVILKQAQLLLVPKRVSELLGLGTLSLMQPVVFAYKLCRKLKLDSLVKNTILPTAYKAEIENLDKIPA